MTAKLFSNDRDHRFQHGIVFALLLFKLGLGLIGVMTQLRSPFFMIFLNRNDLFLNRVDLRGKVHVAQVHFLIRATDQVIQHVLQINIRIEPGFDFHLEHIRDFIGHLSVQHFQVLDIFADLLLVLFHFVFQCIQLQGLVLVLL